MKRYEYMTVDLSAEPSFNVHVKLDRYIAKLNEYGILTHCAPSSIVKKLDPDYGTDELTDFLETVRQRCRFAWWFFGHYHRNQIVDERYILQWEQISGLEF